MCFRENSGEGRGWKKCMCVAGEREVSTLSLYASQRWRASPFVPSGNMQFNLLLLYAAGTAWHSMDCEYCC